MLARVLYAIINILLPHSVCATFLIENAVTNVTRKYIYVCYSICRLYTIRAWFRDICKRLNVFKYCMIIIVVCNFFNHFAAKFNVLFYSNLSL